MLLVLQTVGSQASTQETCGIKGPLGERSEWGEPLQNDRPLLQSHPISKATLVTLESPLTKQRQKKSHQPNRKFSYNLSMLRHETCCSWCKRSECICQNISACTRFQQCNSSHCVPLSEDSKHTECKHNKNVCGAGTSVGKKLSSISPPSVMTSLH